MPPPPPRICIIPTPTADDATTILTLPHPRTSTPARYLLHPTRGLHELTKVPSSSSSWLITPPTTDPTAWPQTGHVLSDGTLYTSTPLDPLFLLLPHILTHSTQFLPLDDLLDPLTDDAESHWAPVIRPGTTPRRHVEARIRAVSDAIDLGEDIGKTYRVSSSKVARVLARKCEAMVSGGLPRTLEEEFVMKPLVRPVSLRVVDVRGELGGDDAKEPQEGNGEATQEKGKEEAKAPSSSSEGRSGENPPPPPPPPPQSASLHLTRLLRLRVAEQFLAATYLPPRAAALLSEHLAASHDFAALDAHLEELKRLRASAAASRSNDFSMKRGADDEEAADARAEKKRKVEEEEKRKKKNVTRGVRELGKVNTRGMAKLTSFFKKKE